MLHYYVNVMKAVFPQFGEYQTEVMALFFLGRLFIFLEFYIFDSV